MENSVFTDQEFEKMSWHDNRVYSLFFPGIDYRLKLDLDYIIEWIRIENDGFQFMMAPAMLCFENVFDLSVQLSFENNTGLYIDEIRRENKRKAPNGKVFIWDYTILTDRGIIKFTATGFNQHFTNIPKVLDSPQYER